MESEFTEVISDKNKASIIITDMAKSVKREALLLLPNDKALNRINKLGVIDFLISASKTNDYKIPRASFIRIICPHSELNLGIIEKIKSNAPNIELQNGPASTHSLFIVDNSKLFSAYVKNADADNFYEAIGMPIYSNSTVNISLFKSLFDLIWNERIINEQMHQLERVQKEFINIAAHELRTPVTPILIIATALKSELEDYGKGQDNNGTNESSNYVKIRKKDFSIIVRSALRLKQLTDDILDVARIESRTLQINKQKFNISEVIDKAVKEHTKLQSMEIKEGWKKEVRIHWPDTNYATFIEADKGRIVQVISNLLSNAVKFTEDGEVFITIETAKGYVTVHVKDEGVGINHEIIPKLFTKFSTKSYHGTGLGLFISKSIIEAHGGRIWANNNPDGKGATFSFSLPF
jgi:two-component system sensor histidine kinase VicK